MTHHQSTTDPFTQADQSPRSSSSSSSSTSTSSSSISSTSPSPLPAAARHHRGRHGDLHVVAIAGVLPYLRQVLVVPGAMLNSDRKNVKDALQLAQNAGVDFWSPGENQVYKSIRSVENAIINLYYTAVVADVAGG